MLETRKIAGKMLYRLPGQATWHESKGDALNVVHRTIERYRVV